MSSYEKINYSLRPAKNIERKMLVEAMKKLSVFNSLHKYQYVGFGSTYFSDFLLVHKVLGINSMISIEQDHQHAERFEFNKPYSCIETIYKHSNDALPTLNWKKPTILWLDYDDPIEEGMFQDISSFFSQAVSGSMFIISVNVQPYEREFEEREIETNGFTIKKLEDSIGRDRLPIDIKDRNLSKTGLPPVIHEILHDQIAEEMKMRNLLLKEGSIFQYKQLFNFIYNDGARMLTIGGVFYNEKDSDKFNASQFDSMSFVRSGLDPFKIIVPALTFKEIRALDSSLPDKIHPKTGKHKEDAKKLPKLKPSDILHYMEIYRYFPNFAEANL